MDFKPHLEKLQNLPEHKKKIILFSVVAIMALSMGTLWVISTEKTAKRIIANLTDYSQNLPPLATSSQLIIHGDSPNTNDWKVVTSTDLNLSVSYPADWKTIAQSNDIIIKNAASGSSFEIVKNSNEKKLALDDWFKQATVVNGRPSIEAAAQPVIINGAKAYKLYSDLPPPNTFFVIVGIANSNNDIFSLYATSNQLGDNDILEKMLSTFKFTTVK